MSSKSSNNVQVALAEAAYSKDGPFKEPIVRCDSCHRLLLMTAMRQTGRCGCGNRKVRNIGSLSIREYLKARFIWRCDPVYFKRFKLVL